MTQDVTTPVQIEAGRAERDGCRCHVSIARCAHYMDTSLFMTDRHHETLNEPTRSLTRFLVGCWGSEGVTYSYEGPDHDAALEAFHAAEERLIRGEPS